MAKENNRKLYPGESNKYKPHEAEKRRVEASQRQAISNGLTPQEKLDKLDAKFGKGLGAVKERQQLMMLIDRETSIKPIQDLIPTISTTISEEMMAEIEAMNDDSSSKKKLKAKERRSQTHKHS